MEFDSAGRVKRTFNPYTVAELDSVRPGDTKFSEASVVDGLGRVTETTLPDGTKTYSYPNEATVSYTSPGGQMIAGTVSRVKDQAGKERRQVIDAFGRIVRVDEPDSSGNLGSVTSPAQPTYYSFDGNDNLTKVTQEIPGGAKQEREFFYDSLSRLLRERQVEAIPTLDATGEKGASAPTKWTGVYKYTGDGLLDWGVDARGVKTDFTYDGLNRVETVEYSGETGYTTPKVTYTYGETETDFFNVGRLTKVETAAVAGQTLATVQNYDYDSVGQVKKHVQVINGQTYGLEYGYNLAGKLTSEKYPSGKIVNMTVDNFGVVQTIADSQRTYLSGVTSAYTASGMTSQVTLGNGTVENYTLNERFQLTSQNLMRGSEVLQKYNYNYGDLDASSNLKNNGKLEQIESYIGSAKQWTQNFRYDSIGRLKESAEKRGDTGALTYKQVFDFDRFGNLYRKVGSNPTTGQQNPIPFTPIEDTDISKSTNRFTTGTTYDDAGKVTTDNKFRSMGFSYDANGRVVKATKASTLDATTVYDALGNRVATKINDVWQYMIYDAFGQLVAEYGTPSEGMGGVKYVQQDHQGSVRTIANASGFVVSRTDHQAFGEAIGLGVGLRTAGLGYGSDTSTRQSYGLTEKDDSTGQRHTWFRKLETQSGRWSSPDPYRGSMSIRDPQSFNRYSYVGNEPINFVDPSGLMPTCPAGEVPFYDPSIDAFVCVKTPSETVTVRGDEPPIEAGPLRLIWRTSRMQNEYGFWLDIRQVPETTVRIGERSPFDLALDQCLKDKVNDRLSRLERQRSKDLDYSFIGAMQPSKVPPPFGGLLNLGVFPDSFNKDIGKEKAGAIAIPGILADPIGTMGNTLGAGVREGTYGAYNHYEAKNKAREITSQDRSECIAGLAALGY